METRYYYDKRHYHRFGSLTEVQGKVTKQSFMVKHTSVIFGSATWDIRIPLDSECLFTNRAEAIAFTKSRLEIQMKELKKEIPEAEKFILSGA